MHTATMVNASSVPVEENKEVKEENNKKKNTLNVSLSHLPPLLASDPLSLSPFPLPSPLLSSLPSPLLFSFLSLFLLIPILAISESILMSMRRVAMAAQTPLKMVAWKGVRNRG